MMIRSSQIEAMQSSMDQEYVARLSAFYRERAPGFVKRFSNGELKQRIAGAVPRARGWGLTSAEGIMQYVGLALAGGPKFHDDPKVQKFMKMPGSTPDVKVKRLGQIIHRKVMEAAERNG